jgi:Arc/MetJ family transcription regulator
MKSKIAVDSDILQKAMELSGQKTQESTVEKALNFTTIRKFGFQKSLRIPYFGFAN